LHSESGGCPQARAEKKRTVRKHATQPYDDRILRFTANESLSLWLLSGREKIGFVGSEHQCRLLAHRKGEIALMLVRGKWYLAAVCNFDDPKLLIIAFVMAIFGLSVFLIQGDGG
jgi:hypothetical protein